MACSKGVQPSDDGGFLFRVMELDCADLRWWEPKTGAGALVWNGHRLDVRELKKDHPLMKQLVVHCINNRHPWDRSTLMLSSNDWVNVRVWWGQADCNIRNNRGAIIRIRRSDLEIVLSASS